MPRGRAGPHFIHKTRYLLLLLPRRIPRAGPEQPSLTEAHFIGPGFYCSPMRAYHTQTPWPYLGSLGLFGLVVSQPLLNISGTNRMEKVPVSFPSHGQNWT